MRTELVRIQLPGVARRPCDAPAALPDRDLTEAEITGLWGGDRAALRACEKRRAAAVRAAEGK